MSHLQLWRAILLLALVAVCAGAALRFANLDGKVLWHDEAHTALRVSGFTTQMFVDDVFSNRILTRDELLTYQQPKAGQGLPATLRALMSRPEHAPLYYLSARLGFYFSDDARTATRTVAALWSLLLLPAVYWLWCELFRERRGALLLVGLVALSPFHIVYAQEARQYSLWAVMTALVCAALLYARRRDDWPAWLLYGLIAAIGLYTHLMLGVVLLVQALWMLWECARTERAVLVRFALSLSLAALLILPWLTLFLGGLDGVRSVTSWMTVPVPLDKLISAWGLHLTRQFVDGPLAPMLVPVAVVLVLTALYIALRYAPRASKRLLFLLLLTTTAIVIGPDLLDGGRRSLEARYLLPALLLVVVLVAFALDWMINRPAAIWRWGGVGLWLALLVGGLWSDIGLVRAEYWWNKSMSSYNHEVARRLNATERPLLVVPNGDINPGEVLSVVHAADARVRFYLLPWDQLPAPAELTGDVFILNPSPTLQERLRQFGTVEPAYEEGRLWRFLPGQ